MGPLLAFTDDPALESVFVESLHKRRLRLDCLYLATTAGDNLLLVLLRLLPLSQWRLALPLLLDGFNSLAVLLYWRHAGSAAYIRHRSWLIGLVNTVHTVVGGGLRGVGVGQPRTAQLFTHRASTCYQIPATPSVHRLFCFRSWSSSQSLLCLRGPPATQARHPGGSGCLRRCISSSRGPPSAASASRCRSSEGAASAVRGRRLLACGPQLAALCPHPEQTCTPPRLAHKPAPHTGPPSTQACRAMADGHSYSTAADALRRPPAQRLAAAVPNGGATLRAGGGHAAHGPDLHAAPPGCPVGGRHGGAV